jgi:hypothetical protein
MRGCVNVTFHRTLTFELATFTCAKKNFNETYITNSLI